MSVVYRDALAEDASALAAFCAATFVDTFGHLYPAEDLTAYLGATYTLAQIGAEIADPEIHYRLAFDAGRIVGYSMTGALKLTPPAPVTEPALELRRLYVAPEAKGAGVAQALMDEAVAWSRDRGAAALYLSVWENNLRAQRFYRRYGFEGVGEHAFMVGAVRDRDLIWKLAL